MADDFSEVGRSGLNIANGIVTEDILTGLRGAAGRKVLAEMAENDPVIGGIILAWEKILARLDWHIESRAEAVELGDDEERKLFVQQCMDDMSDSWASVLSNILTMVTYGWAYMEIVYKKRGGPSDDPTQNSNYADGKIGWRKWAIRSQTSLLMWVTDPAGGIQGMTQESMDGTFTIPIEKSLLFRTSSLKGNPEGRSLLRNAYRPWYFKKRIEELEAIGIERDLAGLPVARIATKYFATNAPQADKDMLTAMQSIVSTVKRNQAEGLVFPVEYDDKGNKMVDFELMSSGGSRQFNLNEVITRYNNQIAMSMLADFIMMGHEKVGTQALGASKIDLWLMAVEALARAIADVVNSHAIPKLLLLNGMPTENAPELVFGSVEQVDITALAGYIKSLSDAGVLLPDTDLEDHLREMGKLPPVNREELATQDVGAGGPVTPGETPPPPAPEA